MNASNVNSLVANPMIAESANNECSSEGNSFIRLQYSTRETVQRLLNYLHLSPDRECDVVKALNKANGNGSLAAAYIRRADARAHRRANNNHHHRLKRNISITDANDNNCHITSEVHANEHMANDKDETSVVQRRQSAHNRNVNNGSNVSLINDKYNADKDKYGEMYTDEEEDEEDDDDLLDL